MNSDASAPLERAVTFRYIAVPFEETSLGGFALWYESIEDAKADFRHFHLYITSPKNAGQSFKVSFTKDSSVSYLLHILIEKNSNEFNVRIARIASEYVERLRDALDSFPYYFITAGYTDASGQARVLPPRDYTFFANVVFVDGERVAGKPRRRWPSELFETAEPQVLDEPVDGSSDAL